CDLRIRSPLLYPTELPGKDARASIRRGRGIRRGECIEVYDGMIVNSALRASILSRLGLAATGGRVDLDYLRGEGGRLDISFHADRLLFAFHALVLLYYCYIASRHSCVRSCVRGEEADRGF